MRLLLFILVCQFSFAAPVVKDKMSFFIQTTDATETVAFSEVLPDEQSWVVRIACQALKTDGAKRSSFENEVSVFRTGAGNATIAGSVTVIHEQAGTPYALDVGVNSSAYEVLVTGLASEDVDWGCIRELRVRGS